MAQWVNSLRNNIFVNALPLPLCEISGALHLAQPGVGRNCVRQENVSGEHIFLGNSALSDRIYCPS